jgi:hypothetical protein
VNKKTENQEPVTAGSPAPGADALRPDEAAPTVWRRPRWLTLLAVAIVLVLGSGIAAYYNSFCGWFLFDDLATIRDYPELHRLAAGFAGYYDHTRGWFTDRVSSLSSLPALREGWPPWKVFDTSYYARPVLGLTLAANYALDAFIIPSLNDVPIRNGMYDLDRRVGGWTFHAVNLAVHLLAALTLFGIVRRTLRTDLLRERFSRVADWLALAAALLWTVHPLQTNGVTYIVQRGESMMSLFYLLTLYAVIRSASVQSRLALGAWCAAAAVASALGMWTKQVMVTAPVLMFLYDRTFLGGSFRETLRRRWGLHLLLAGTWLALGFYLLRAVSSIIEPPVEAGPTPPMPTRLEYLLSQPAVLVHYLRLAFVPYPLCLDYWWPIAKTAWDIVPYVIPVAALLGLTLWAAWRRPALGFAGLWFFLILAPTCSIVPMEDLCFEHRMYLPLAGVIAAAVCAAYVGIGALLRRWTPTDEPGQRHAAWIIGVVLGAALNGALAVAVAITIARKVAGDTAVDGAVETAGVIAGAFGSALGGILAAILLRRWMPAVAPGRQHTGWVIGIAVVGAVASIFGYLTYLRNQVFQSDYNLWFDIVTKRPKNPRAQYTFGNVLARRDRLEEAIVRYREALRLDPNRIDAHNNLANVMLKLRRLPDAEKEYRAAVRLKPDYPEIWSNLGLVLAMQGRREEATACFKEALRIRPDCPEALHNMRLMFTQPPPPAPPPAPSPTPPPAPSPAPPAPAPASSTALPPAALPPAATTPSKQGQGP